MKRIFLSLLIVLLMQNIVFAVQKQYLYVVKNISPNELFYDIQNIVNSKNTEIDKSKNIIYLNDKIFYYFKIYKVNNNSEIYLYTTDKNISSLINQLPQKVYPLNDKSSIIQYNNDFIRYAQYNNINNPKIKSIKSKFIKNKYKTYRPYNRRLRNVVLETTDITENKITIERKKLLPETKIKRYVYAYEYTIYNNNNSDIVITKVASADFIGRRQIRLLCLIPGKEFIPGYGLPYKIRTTIERKRFTKTHPQEETIKPGDKMRILAISKKKINPVADFYFKVNNEDIILTIE